ncbi:unnamed protein product [Dibothriocephalus latus]|uniref:Helicase ATP-binding domain-containing protein n=1 Tax=Dibothriocephalus latus TaxID=60516 RepID=A0A3P7NS91_DIBLA|nr:unnamed protein product [Dibothriocephalus latus]
MRRCTYVVLDEADRMFDLGFEPQVMRIVENCRPDRQTVMFSATFPRQMEVLARKALTNPIEVQVGGRSVVCGDIVQKVVSLSSPMWVLPSEEDKVLKLLELLGIYQEQGSVLVFVEKQESADELMRFGYHAFGLILPFLTTAYFNLPRRTGRAGRKGYAHTFITPDQERNAGDLVKAFSLSGQPVPEDIYLLYEGYKERMMMVSCVNRPFTLHIF